MRRGLIRFLFLKGVRLLRRQVAPSREGNTHVRAPGICGSTRLQGPRPIRSETLYTGRARLVSITYSTYESSLRAMNY